jgi:hypothetical protein
LDACLEVRRQTGGTFNCGRMAGKLEFHQPPKVGSKRQATPAFGVENSFQDLPGTSLVQRFIDETQPEQMFGFPA